MELSFERPCGSSLISPLGIDLVHERLTCEGPVVVLEDLQGSRCGIGDAGNVRSDFDPGMPPEWMPLWQWLLAEDIEQRPGEMTGIQGG